MNALNTNFLLASLVWGSVGVIYCIIGRRRQKIVSFIGGMAMILVSYLVSSALLMSLICSALMLGVFWFGKQED